MLANKTEIKNLLQVRINDLTNRQTERKETGNISRLLYIQNHMLNMINFDKLNIEFANNGLIELGHLLENFSKCFLSAKTRKNIKSSRTLGGDFTANKILFEIKSLAINPSTKITNREKNKPLLVILVDNQRVGGNNFQVSHHFYVVARNYFQVGEKVNKAKLLEAIDADKAYEFDNRQELNEILEWASL